MHSGYTCAVITVSDKARAGKRVDSSGPACCKILEDSGYVVERKIVVSDDREEIAEELIRCTDELKLNLVVTTGGTGFSKRDVTPEVTAVIGEKMVPGIGELMRFESSKVTPRGALSRGIAAIRGGSLIVNLPGSEKAATECLSYVVEVVKHGMDVLLGSSVDCGESNGETSGKILGKVLSVCTSQDKGVSKLPAEEVKLIEGKGIEGDAHLGSGHRQVSLLGVESVEKIQRYTELKLEAGAFAENILTEGIVLYELEVGTEIAIGGSLCRVTQIGKECHKGCAIREITGDCVMPREGVFVEVVRGGIVTPGDVIEVDRPSPVK